MKIFNASEIEILDIVVDDSSYRYRAIMSEDSLTLKFSVTAPLSIPVGSYCEFQGERYTLYYPENFKKHNTRNFEYTLVLHSWREALKLYIYKDTSAKPYRVKFPLTATPDTFLQQLINVMNLHDSGWAKGDVIVADEKLISFNHESCYDALNRIAQEFDTEWEVVNKTIHLHRVEKFKEAPLPMSYGKGKGFVSGVGRANNGDHQPIGRMYVEGGERNIDYSQYGSRSLLLPKSATLLYEGKTYRTDADGMYITRDGNTNKAEGSYDGTRFYPKRVGTVTAVEVIDAEKHFYDIIDTGIPEVLDYSQHRIAGEKATIIFQSGALAGREFDIEQTDDALTGYIHAERRFKIVPQELDGMIMPGGVFVPAVGDKYAIFNISMPQAYISDDVTQTGASWDMFRDSVKVFARQEENPFTFTGQMDGVWSRSQWLEIGGKIVPGGHILFSDEQFLPNGSVIRIIGVKDYVNAPHKPEITLSNASVATSLSSVIDDLESEEVVREADKEEIRRFAKRQWRDAKETMRLLESSLLNFSGSINPIVVQTMQLLVGDPSLQFRFVNSKITPQVVDHVVTFDPETSIFSSAAGILQHMTIGITGIKKTHSPEEYKYWDMAAYLSPPLDPLKSYYLYAKCESAGTTGIFLLSETAIKMEAVAGYYHFLVGILNSEYDGNRSFAQMYGFTEILPGRITTDKITSADGLTYFDLVNGIIGGRIRFLHNGAETDMSSWADGVLGEIDDTNQAINDLDTYVDGAFHDGVIEEAEAKSIEKYLNQVNKEKSELEATYNKLYVNPLLSGTPKTNLLNAKITLFGDIDSLISIINNVIADGKVNAAEKTQVDTAFATYKDSLANFKTRVEEANQSIESIIKDAADSANSTATSAQSAAEDAQAAANAAQSSATTANNVLANIASDTKLNPVEKKSVRKEWDVIAAEVPVNDSQATLFGITTEKTTYDNAFQALATYLNGGSTWTSGVPSWINDSNLSTTTTIVGSTFRSKFKAYYDARIALLNAIAAKAKYIADNAQATANIAKAITDKFGTTIDGGLINTVTMLLREAGSTTETAGITGIQGVNLDNPSFWSGGTYAQALGLIEFLYNMSGGTPAGTDTGQFDYATKYAQLAKITMLHNGAGKYGDFIVLENGSIIMVDPTTGQQRVTFSVQDLPDLATLLSTTSPSGSAANNSVNTTVSIVELPDTINVTKNGSTIRFKIDSNLAIDRYQLSADFEPGADPYSKIYGRVDLYKDGILYGNIVTVVISSSSTTASIVIDRTFINCPSGTYSVRLRWEWGSEPDPHISNIRHRIGNTTLSWSFVQSGVRRFQFGKNGFMAFYSLLHLYLSETDGLDIKGKTNMPGVLLSGTVGINGGFGTVWGAKKHESLTAQRNSIGYYTVFHSIGHTDYSVQITPETDQRVYYVPTSGKGADRFNVYFRSLSGSLSDSAFSFSIHGNNYVPV